MLLSVRWLAAFNGDPASLAHGNIISLLHGRQLEVGWVKLDLSVLNHVMVRSIITLTFAKAGSTCWNPAIKLNFHPLRMAGVSSRTLTFLAFSNEAQLKLEPYPNDHIAFSDIFSNAR